MKTLTKWLVVALAPVLMMLAALSHAQAKDFLVLQTSKGTVEIELFSSVAPKHVARIKKLANSGFYDGIVFHRVIEGFMAQTGDPTGTGTGGSNEPDLKAEFSNVPFDRGVVGMARTADPNSANSQFFITFDQAYHLNKEYTVLGKVSQGMESIDALQRGRGAGGVVPVEQRDRIIKATVVTR